jgi:hypothetical protein
MYFGKEPDDVGETRGLLAKMLSPDDLLVVDQ